MLVCSQTQHTGQNTSCDTFDTMTIKQNKHSKYYQSTEERLAKKDWSNRKQVNKQKVLLDAKRKALLYKNYLKEEGNL